MSVIRDIKIKNNGGTYDTYDIGASANNVSYDNSHSVKDKIDALGTAATKDVPASGDAGNSEVVLGNDTRLSDARTPVSHTHTVSQISDFPQSMPASDVYDWAKASTKPLYTASEVGAVATTVVGTANGVAELDENGKVPSAQLPSYVDDVLEYSSSSSFPATGETGKIYVDTTTNKTYRWGGSDYVEISESLALGETSSTAFAGNRGKAIEDKIPSTASTSNKLVTVADLNILPVNPSTIPSENGAIWIETA